MGNDQTEPDYILLSQAKKDQERREQEREGTRRLIDSYPTTNSDRVLLKQVLGLDGDRAIQ